MFRNQLKHELNLDKRYELVLALPNAMLFMLYRTLLSGKTIAQFVKNLPLFLNKLKYEIKYNIFLSLNA